MARPQQTALISPAVDAALEGWVCAILTEPSPASAEPSVSADECLRFTEFHGITALVYAKTRKPTRWLRDDLRDAMREAARYQAAREIVLRQEVVTILAAAERLGIQPLLLKGAALAYALYPEPSLRGRNDTDLLVAPDDKAPMIALLEGLGYVGDVISGEHWATSERSFTRQVASGITSRIDVHWRINNSPVFWHAGLEHKALAASAQPLAALHPSARCPDFPAMFLHAGIHRASHVRAPMEMDGVKYVVVNRLIWLYDIHLLSAAMTDAGWTRLLAISQATGLLGICRSAVEATADRFGTVIPGRVTARLQRLDRESASDLLDGGAWQTKLMEFRALPSREARWGWLREHLLPHRTYMRARYPLNPRAPLALLHLKRLLLSRRPSSTS